MQMYALILWSTVRMLSATAVFYWRWFCGFPFFCPCLDFNRVTYQIRGEVCGQVVLGKILVANYRFFYENFYPDVESNFFAGFPAEVPAQCMFFSHGCQLHWASTYSSAACIFTRRSSPSSGTLPRHPTESGWLGSCRGPLIHWTRLTLCFFLATF